MDGSELQSFIQKFQQLWQTGLSAHLDLDTHAGQAWVGLRVRLGQAPGHPHQEHFPTHQRSRNTPARQRRRARRYAARQEVQAEQAVNVVINLREAENSEAEEADAEEAETEEAEAEEAEEIKDESESAAIADVVDKHDEIDISNEPTYCKICKECPAEFETAEDVSYHVMNNHETQDVLLNYGKPWIEERRYCIRRFSPFSNWFSTPFIS